MIAYDDEAPAADIRPIFTRCSNLAANKRAILHFMPRQLLKWDPMTNIFNPTISRWVLKVIAEVNLFEVRRQGTPTQVRRPIELDEFLNVLDIIRDVLKEDDDLKRYRLAAVLCCQWQLIGRIDDMMKLQVEHLGINHNHPGMASTKICWSRNIAEEREAAGQVIFWCNNTNMCPLLSLDVYLDVTG
jgi:hypothetical protein